MIVLINPLTGSESRIPRSRVRLADSTLMSTTAFLLANQRALGLVQIVKFYEFLGMSLIKKLEFPEAKFDLYFLGYDSPNALSHGRSVFDREGLIELTHNYGTENDPDYQINNGNKEPHRGFGHTCISVDYIQAACKRLEDAGYKFQKRLDEGRMKYIAFALDPDGYWVEIIADGKKTLEEMAEVRTTDVSTYRMVRSEISARVRPVHLGRANIPLEPHHDPRQRHQEVTRLLPEYSGHVSPAHN